MSEPGNIRKFEYRPCRIATGFSVDFVAGAETFHGLCKDISDTGIRAAFDNSLTPGVSGILTLHHESSTLEVEAQVGYVEKTEAGLTFLFKSAWERDMTTEFINTVANRPAASPAVRYI